MKYTGIFATKEETEECLKLAKEAYNTPVMTLNSGMEDFATSARRMMYDKVNRLAEEHGLPKIVGNYGLTKEGEFVTE
jgi:tRNA(Ile)-lysidine synthase TilS/MesJ